MPVLPGYLSSHVEDEGFDVVGGVRLGKDGLPFAPVTDHLLLQRSGNLIVDIRLNLGSNATNLIAECLPGYLRNGENVD